MGQCMIHLRSVGSSLDSGIQEAQRKTGDKVRDEGFGCCSMGGSDVQAKDLTFILEATGSH